MFGSEVGENARGCALEVAVQKYDALNPAKVVDVLQVFHWGVVREHDHLNTMSIQRCNRLICLWVKDFSFKGDPQRKSLTLNPEMRVSVTVPVYKFTLTLGLRSLRCCITASARVFFPTAASSM